MKIIVPNEKMVQGFQKEIISLFELIKNNSKETEAETLTELRDTLLPKLIRGEVRVKEIASAITEVL